jgi:coenzyme F420 hydrogenase subunit beta
MLYSSKNRTYVPFVSRDKCTNCEICYRVCPGLHVYRRGSDEKFEFGRHIKCFIGHAADSEIRHNASSGGIATAISLVLLESESPAAVVATRMKEKSIYDTEPTLCKSGSEVLRAMGSKYCPAATNSILKDLNGRPNHSIVFIGLPCHIQGIRNAQEFEPLKKIDNVITIGLLCGGMKGQGGTKWILKSRNIAAGSVRDIKYRGCGWPGVMEISFKDQKDSIKIPYSEYYDEFFESWHPWRCLLCLDRTAESADISLGDAWLPELKEDSQGTSIIIARTDKGLRIIEKAIEHKAIKAFEVSSETLWKSQLGLWTDINNAVKPTLYLAKLIGRKVPDYQMVLANPGTKKIIKQARNVVRSVVLRKMTTSNAFFKFIEVIRKLKERSQVLINVS